MSKPFWFQNLSGGMDQATNSALVINNESPLHKNVSFDRPGLWASRKGTDLLQSKISANQGWGLMTLSQTDNTHTMLAVVDRDLYALDESTGWGSPVDTDEWPADKRVDGVNFLNRYYLGSEDGATALAYTTGGGITDVTPTIGGSQLAVNKSILACAGNDIKPNVIFYTDAFTDNFHSATGTCAADADSEGAGTVTTTTEIFEASMEGAILYNTTDGVMAVIEDWVDADTVITDSDTSGWNNDTVYVLQNAFKLDGPAQGVVGYQEQFISFDNSKMYMWDPTTDWDQDIDGYGCVNYRSIKVIDGVLIWCNRDGVWLYSGKGMPENISAKIQDKIDGYGIFDLIDPSKWGEICAGVDHSRGKYYLSVGTLQTLSGAPASAIANAVLVYDTRAGTWHVRSYPDQIVAFTNFVNNNDVDNLYGIGKGDAAVWKMETGTTDDDAAGTAGNISVDMRTPHHVLGDPRFTHRVKFITIKYSSSAQVTVTYSKDRGSYSSLVTLASTSGSPKVVEIKLPADNDATTHGLKFTSTGVFQIEGYGFEAEEGKTTRLVAQ